MTYARRLLSKIQESDETDKEEKLLKEFIKYGSTKGALRKFDRDALLFGLKRAWKNKDYGTILSVVRKIPKEQLFAEENAKILLYYDLAQTRKSSNLKIKL